MKKYLGSKIDSSLAIFVPLYVCGFLLFGIYNLTRKGRSGTTILLAIVCFFVAICFGLYLIYKANELYSWGFFRNEEVRIKKGFSKRNSYTLVYEKCRSCGIGFFTHHASSFDEGDKVYFIFLSYEKFNVSYRSKINRWKNTETQMKAEYSIELYEYLRSVLPENLSEMLLQDYEKYIKNRFRQTPHL